MKAMIYSINSPDVYDLETYNPENDNFCLFIELGIGPVNGLGFEIFGLTVCTPKWLLNNRKKDDIIFGRHYLIVFKYNYTSIYNAVSKYISAIEEDTWNKIAVKIGRIAHWEFEDYKHN